MPELCQNLLHLPYDIIFLILQRLDVTSFLSFTSTSRSLRHPELRFNAEYWRHATQTTFRVPNRPVVAADGRLWQSLYKRLLTQSRVYTWGQNAGGCLGHSALYDSTENSGIPLPLRGSEDIGVVADLQCGGWSTALLNSEGQIFVIGDLDGQRSRGANTSLRRMRFPASSDSTTHEAHRTIRQFSLGRSQLIGVSDSGCLWLWHDAFQHALRLKFLHHDIRDQLGEAIGPPRRGYVQHVVAGWNKNSALVSGSGIIVWGLLSDDLTWQSLASQVDAVLIYETAIVPQTSFSLEQPTEALGRQGDGTKQAVDRATKHILLEHYVVWITDSQRLFCARMFDRENSSIDIPHSIELFPLQRTSSEDKAPCVKDIYGSFRKFALIKSTGEVLIIDQNFLHHCWRYAFEGRTDALITLQQLPEWEVLLSGDHSPDDHNPDVARWQSLNGSYTHSVQLIPALQNSGVMALAIGDYHLHALHSAGHITSYGKESQKCGSLGLGPELTEPQNSTDIQAPLVILRGLVDEGVGIRPDGLLLPHTYRKGRQVWFQREKYLWLAYLAKLGLDLKDSSGGRAPLHSRSLDTIGEVSDWIEEAAHSWDQRQGVRQLDEDGFVPHFVMSVAAAGWHSGALVLVNNDLEARIRQSCIVEGSQEKTACQGSHTKDDTEKSHETTSQDEIASEQTSLLTRARQIGRNYLGLTSEERSESIAPVPVDSNRFPGPGKRYVWAFDRFPRVRLNDGSIIGNADGENGEDT